MSEIEWKVISADGDTNRLLNIAALDLTRFFGYSEQRALSLVSSFYVRFAARFENDFYHHEGAFRSAALMHYSEVNGRTGDFGCFQQWFSGQELQEAEIKALSYFRDLYFKKEA
jgi:hypothetical protein